MENRINKKLIGENINALAKYYGFKIKDIEKEANVSTGYLSRITGSKGAESSPIIDLLLVASQKFHVSIDSLVSMDFKKLADPEKMRFQCFLEALLTLTNRDQLKWERFEGKDICKEIHSAGFFCKYDKDICFYIFELEFDEEEYPGYTFYVSNKGGEPSQIARYNLPGPASYETLRQIFESAASSTEFVTISEDADAAIRKFMYDNELLLSDSSEESKYRSLYEYLLQCPQESVILTFNQMEDILGFPLPPSAWKHNAFWANNVKGHSHCRSWVDAGFKTVDVSSNTIEQRVHFQRVE